MVDKKHESKTLVYKSKMTMLLLEFITFLLHISPIQCPASVSLSNINFNSIFHQGLMVEQQQGPVSLVHSSLLYTTKHRSDIKTDQISNITPVLTSVQLMDISRSVIGFDERSVYSSSSATKKDGVVTSIKVNNIETSAVWLESSSTSMALTSSMSLHLHPSPLEVQTTVTSTTNIHSAIDLSSEADASAFCSLSPSLSYFYVSSFLQVNCTPSNNTDSLFTSSSIEYTSANSSLLRIKPTKSLTAEEGSLNGNSVTDESSTPDSELCSRWGPVETSSTVYVKVCPTSIQSSSSIFITPSPCFKLINISRVQTRYKSEQCSEADTTAKSSNITGDKNENLKNKTKIEITGSMDLKVTSMCSSKFLTTLIHQMNVSCGYSMEWSIPIVANTVTHKVNRSAIEATPSINTTDILRTCSYSINSSDCLLGINTSHVFKPPNQTSSVVIKIEYEYLEEDRELTGAIILVTTFMLQIFSFAAVVALTAREKIKTANTVLHWSEKPADESMTTEV